MKNLISASILNADLLRLGEVVRNLENAGADMLHFDVMDGVFVNNISFGIPVLRALSESSSLFMDVHLMITDPIRYVDAFAEAGADLITFHYESVSDPDATIAAIHRAGCKAGISVKPATPAQAVAPYLDRLDAVLAMTVEPGFGGQGFMEEMTAKIAELRRMITASGREIMLEVDGGINDRTAPVARNAGADVMVAGSYLFRQEHLAEALAGLRAMPEEGEIS